ncbi:hypothetical protein BJ170DRAFT_624008 [Xylariales sp. AK1849]|nr:hypothetical protein BJ170DRAFT_624008 [Xylariales sp. AK1849]
MFHLGLTFINSKQRRVKCDEKRPACVRCTSTGRKCDGYANPVPPALAKKDDVRDWSSSRALSIQSSLRVAKQLSPDIQGTETERRYFHRFRVEALKGLTLHAAGDAFWERLVPQVAHHDEAVKHALVALGSAYQLRVQRDSSVATNETPGLEIFTLQQYNKAIQSLSQQMASSSRKRIEMTLLCCLVFVCLESLRNNRDGATVHLANGLKIIEQLPTSMLNDVRSQTASKVNSDQRYMSRSELRQLLECYGDLEFGTQVYSAYAKPVSAPHLYQTNSHDDDTSEDYKDLSHCHAALLNFGHRVFLRLWETLPHRGNKAFWSNPEQIRLHTQLLERARHLIWMVDRFMSGPSAPRQETNRTDYASGLLDRLHSKGLHFTIYCMPEDYTRRQLRQFEEQYREIVQMVEEVVGVFEGSSQPDRSENGGAKRETDKRPAVTLDNGILLGLHVALYGTSDRDTKRRAMDLLRRMKGRNEGMFNASDMLKVFQVLGADGHGSYANELLLDEPAGPCLGGAGGFLGFEARLAALKI